MRADQMRHFKIFHPVGSPVQLIIGRWEQMQSSDDCLDRLVWEIPLAQTSGC
jgi:hypothetical protein